jgi:large subunit ribosomal protein L22
MDIQVQKKKERLYKMANNIAKAKYLRISPDKVRRIANEIVKKNVLEAEAYLSVLPNKGALALKKVIHSARTNFLSNNNEVDEENLIVNKILVDIGATFKRFHPVSKGRAYHILKRTCHILVEVGVRSEEKEDKAVVEPKGKVNVKNSTDSKEKSDTKKATIKKGKEGDK